MKPELKKLLILNAPYLLFVYLFDKIGQAVRLSPGTDLSGKVLSLADGFSAAFANPLPSLAPMDLLIGIAGAVLIRLMVYFKGKNAKKYRKGIEYGSARWGNAEDIKPYIDPVFQNNVLLTQTERLNCRQSAQRGIFPCRLYGYPLFFPVQIRHTGKIHIQRPLRAERRFFLGVCTCTQRPFQSQNKSRFQSDKAANRLFCGGSLNRTAAVFFTQRQHRDEPCGYGDDCRHAPLLPACHV